MRKKFFIITGIFILVMLICISITIYLAYQLSNLNDRMMGTHTNLHDYKLHIPDGIVDLNTLYDDSLDLMCVYVDEEEKTIYMSHINQRVNKDNYLFVPEDKRTYMSTFKNALDSTYE